MRRRRRAALPGRDPRRLPLRDRRRRPPVGRPAGAARPRPGAARGLGQPVGHPPRLPAPARRPDQLGDAGQRHRGGGVMRARERPRPLPRSARRRPAVDRADAPPPRRPGARPSSRRRTPSRGRAGVPRRARPGPRRSPPLPRRPPGARRRRLRRADVRRRRGPRHQHRRAPRPPPRRHRHPAAAGELAGVAIARGAPWRGRWRCGPAARAPRSCTARSASRRPASGPATTREPRTPS